MRGTGVGSGCQLGPAAGLFSIEWFASGLIQRLLDDAGFLVFQSVSEGAVTSLDTRPHEI
jgi:hypothetical protein